MKDKKFISVLSLLVFMSMICQPAGAVDKKSEKNVQTSRRTKQHTMIFYKNETWKSRWKWNTLISGTIFSTVALIYVNSKQKFVKARNEVSLDEDKKALNEEIQNHDLIINISGSLAVISIGSSIYLFATDDSGVQKAIRKYLPDIRISRDNYRLGWTTNF